MARFARPGDIRNTYGEDPERLWQCRKKGCPYAVLSSQPAGGWETCPKHPDAGYLIEAKD